MEKQSTSVLMSDEAIYQKLKEDFKAVHEREPKVQDMLEGLDRRIKNDTSDVAFNFVSSMKAKQLKDLFISSKVEIVERKISTEKAPAKAGTPDPVTPPADPVVPPVDPADSKTPAAMKAKQLKDLFISSKVEIVERKISTEKAPAKAGTPDPVTPPADPVVPPVDPADSKTPAAKK